MTRYTTLQNRKADIAIVAGLIVMELVTPQPVIAAPTEAAETIIHFIILSVVALTLMRAVHE